MNNISFILDDYIFIYIFILFFSGLFLFMFICTCISIIKLNKNIKDLVDLEYKKYQELKNESSSSISHKS